MGAAQAMKRIPRIKFPQRHPKASGTTRQVEEVSGNDDAFKNDDLVRNFFSRAPSSTSLGGKASDQPKRTPVTQEEIDAVMVYWEVVSDSVHQSLANRISFQTS
ncbi:hypothetical protein CASFOL_002458 [Castilleja foliolosa]|uniref:Uncharacterized protein n=1 Tax=Castilleja foliolosa TaxID=1961234 RepID=A0ABD3EGB5_9LAMI